jgi:hypothetical protein
MFSQGFGKAFAPPLQVGLARIEPGAVDALGLEAQMDVRMLLVVVRGEDILEIAGKFGFLANSLAASVTALRSVPGGIESTMLKASFLPLSSGMP